MAGREKKAATGGGVDMEKSWTRLALVVTCVVAISGCAPKQQTLSDEEAYQRFVGTWVNTTYSGTRYQTQVTVIRPDHVGEDWPFPTSAAPVGQWDIKVKKTWVDDTGNTYCQFISSHADDPTDRSAALMQVDKNRNVWECSLRVIGGGTQPEADVIYPEKIDQEAQVYYIYYRKK
jgi:hypothetical protein